MATSSDFPGNSRGRPGFSPLHFGWFWAGAATSAGGGRADRRPVSRVWPPGADEKEKGEKEKKRGQKGVSPIISPLSAARPRPGSDPGSKFFAPSASPRESGFPITAPKNSLAKGAKIAKKPAPSPSVLCALRVLCERESSTGRFRAESPPGMQPRPTTEPNSPDGSALLR